MGVGVPCTSWVTRISHLTILSVHFLACRIKEGEFAALCCPARVAFAQASPLHRPLPEQPPPFSRPARLHPWGCTQRLSGVPFTFPGSPMLVPLPKSLPKHHTEYRQAASLSCWLLAGPAILLKKGGLPHPSWHTQWPIPGQREQNLCVKCVIGAEEGAIVSILSH